MITSRLQTNRRPFARNQRGVVLVIALIVLVAMTLAAIGMTRSIDTANLVAGNIGFKQSSLNAADKGIEAGFAWLLARAGTAALNSNDATGGYLSSTVTSGFDWKASTLWAQSAEVDDGSEDAAGNTINFVIQRLCSEPNKAYNETPNQCVLSMPSGGASTGGSMAIGSVVFEGTPQTYYRITARSRGPKNTESYVQSIVAISN